MGKDISLAFNVNKTIDDYEKKQLFMNPEPGLLDTVNQHYPKLDVLYKLIKSLDWDEQEFDYRKSFKDFETVAPHISEMMLETLGWQWEADTVASTNPLFIISCFNPDGTLYTGEVRIADQENLHSRTYSEINRISIPNAREVMNRIINNQDTMRRLGVVGSFMHEMTEAATNYLSNKSLFTHDEIYHNMVVFYAVLLYLERIQFMASFAITFSICELGVFQPIGTAVRRICQDELEGHVAWRKQVLRELKSELIDKGKEEVYNNAVEHAHTMFREVVESELLWTEKLFEGRALPGTTVDIIKSWVLYNSKDVANFMGYPEDEFEYPKENPLKHLSEWFNMSEVQPANQEQDNPSYKVGVTTSDVDDDDKFTF